MSKIVLRFVSNRSLISLLVRFFTKSKFSHVDYMIGSRAYSALPSTGVDYNSNKSDYEEYYEMEVNDKTKIDAFLLQQRGKPYDWKAIFGMPFSRSWNDSSSWFCSELIAAAINQDTLLYNESVHRITPRDLYIHPMMKKMDI